MVISLYSTVFEAELMSDFWSLLDGRGGFCLFVIMVFYLNLPGDAVAHLFFFSPNGQVK